jgi:Tol biopolymer transport system component
MKSMAVTRTLLGLFALLAGFGRGLAQEPKTTAPPKAAAPKPNDGKETPDEAVSRLVEQLRLHPPKPTTAADRLALYMIDVEKGEASLIADQPDPGLNRCGSPEWSHDGKRIIFDAMALNQVPSTHLKVIELVDGKLAMTDLGLGNCPTFSPTDDRIAFLNNSNAAGAGMGVWLMQADGSQRRALGDYGRPKWSPDSRQFFIVGFDLIRQVTLMDVRPEKSGPLHLAGQSIFPDPSWASNELLVAPIGTGEPDTIALIDVSEPGQAKIRQVLWKRGKGPDVAPYNPVYSPVTRRCVFVGSGTRGKALYAFRAGRPDPPQRLEPEGYDRQIVDLASSPDGRFVLFSGDRPGRRQPPPAPASDAAGSRKGAGVERRKTP